MLFRLEAAAWQAARYTVYFEIPTYYKHAHVLMHMLVLPQLPLDLSPHEPRKEKSPC